MIDGNTAALEAYMREQDRAEEIYNDHNTVDNVRDVWTYLLTDDFMYVMEQVIDDPVANLDIIVTLAEIVNEIKSKPEVLAKLEQAFELSYPDWFDELVDKELRRRAGLSD